MVLIIHKGGKIRTEKRETTYRMYVHKINYLKLMKREISVEIWLKSAKGNHKEAKNQKGVFE